MRFRLCATAVLLGIPSVVLGGGDLSGSASSMRKQNHAAMREDYEFSATPEEVQKMVARGALEALYGNSDYMLSGVSFPYARPEIREFIEQLGAEYRKATGERLVVTSLTRPISNQPANAHVLSVHPAGMAMDLRIPANAIHREWLERRLLLRETEGVIDATKERSGPAHYHVALFPAEFRAVTGAARAAASLSDTPADSIPVTGLPADMAIEAAAAENRGPSTPVILAIGSLLLVTGGMAASARRR